MTLLDFILVLLTGGLWLIWILIKYLRSNSWAQHSSKTNKNTMRCIVLLFGIRLPLFPASAHMVAARRGEAASFSSLCLSSLTWPGKYLLIKYLRKTPVQHRRFWCLVSGGYLFSRPRLPQCGKVVQRRRRSSNSLPYWISCSLHRPPGALTVDPITSPWLFDLARKIPTHQRPKKNTMRCMVFFFGIRRLPIFPGRHQPSIFGV